MMRIFPQLFCVRWKCKSILFLLIFLLAFLADSQEARATAASDSMLGYWKFDGNLADSSGDNSMASLAGTTFPNYDASHSPLITFPNTQSVNFDGANSYLTFANQTGLKPTIGVSLSFWVYLPADPLASSIVAGNYLATYDRGFFFTIDPANTSFSVGNGTISGTASFSTTNILAGTWVLLIGTWDGTTVKLYQNGTLNDSTPFAGPLDYTGTAFQAGNFTGRIDDMRLYKRALTLAEIADLAAGHHTTATWNGSVDSYYENPNNWTPVAVPDLYALVDIANTGNQPALAVNESMAGLKIANGAQFNLTDFIFALTDGGIFSNDGTLSLYNTQTFSGITNDINSGTILINYTAATTGLRLGSEYYNLTINNTNGTTLTLASNLNVHNNLTLVSGTLDVSGSNYGIILNGNWLNTGGIFQPRSGTVTLNGANQSITGSNDFYNLSKSTSTAETLTFQAGTTQTIVGALNLQGAGASSQFLSLRSTTNGTSWNINPQGTRNISAVDVRDSNLSAPSLTLQGRNIDSGNNNANWIFDTMPPVITPDAVTSPTSNNRQPVTGTVQEESNGFSVSLVQFQMDTTGGSWMNCTANDSLFDELIEQFTCTPSSALSEGSHTMYVRATDANSNTTVSSYPAVTFVIDALHTLTYTAGSGGSITGTATQIINHNSNGSSVTAVPDIGYHFVNWSDSSTSNPRTDSSVVADISVTANFVIDTYTLNYLSGANGTLSGTVSQTVSYGSSSTSVIANPAIGYHFVNWSDSSTANPRTDSNVTADISVTANFTIDTYTVTFDKTTGDIDANPTSKTADYNTTVNSLPTAPTKTGHTFSGWNNSIDGTGSEFTTATAVTGNVTVYAQWIINAYTLTYIAGANGTLSGSTSQTVNYSAWGTAVIAVANTNYYFTGWSDGSTQNPRTDIGVANNISVTANFAINTFTLKYKNDGNGKVVGDDTQTISYGGNGSEVEANSDTGYQFKKWSDGSEKNPRKDENILADLTVTAEFEKKEYALKYNSESGGSIDGDTTQTVKYEEDGDEVIAVPDENYHFTGWSDGKTNKTRTDTDIREDLNVKAEFALIETPASNQEETSEPASQNTTTTTTIPVPKIDFNGDTTPNWQTNYFGSAYCYEETRCGGTADPDKDGINNNEEFRLGTDPLKSDSDQDGTADGAEIEAGRSPVKSGKSGSSDRINYENPKDKGETKKESYKVNNVEMIDDSSGNKRLKVSGKALPNRFVTVYVYSDPIVLTVETDDDGNWSYILDKELEDGEHYVYVAVTDSEGKIAEKSEPLTFIKTAEAITIIPPAEASATDRAKSPVEAGYQKNLALSIFIGIGALILAIVAIGFIRHKKMQVE